MKLGYSSVATIWHALCSLSMTATSSAHGQVAPTNSAHPSQTQNKQYITAYIYIKQTAGQGTAYKRP